MKRILLLFFVFSCLLGEAQVAFNVDSVTVWRDPELGEDGTYNVYNEVWAYAKDGREYAILGASHGAYILDITNVRKPVLIDFVRGAFDRGVNRDYHDHNGYLYMVCDQGPSTLQILDLQYLPDSVHLVYDDNALMINCHNIFIDSLTEKLYACGVTIPDTGSGRRVDMQIYDLSSGYVPKLLLTIDDDQEFHDVYVKNDTAFGNRGRSGLFIYDFTDTDNYFPIWSAKYDEEGYNHSGYATEDGAYYFMGHETFGVDLMSVKINDFDEPEKVRNFNAGVNENSIVAHNLLVRDSLLFVSYYHEGLQVYDVSDGSNPVKVGHYITYTETKGEPPIKDYSTYDGAWGVYPFLPSGYILISDRAKGLFIFDIADIDGNHHPELLPKRTVFPNPASTYLDIVMDPRQINKIEIFDLNGKLIEESESMDEIKNIGRYYFKNSLQAGIYIVRIESNEDVFSVRFVKE